MTCGVVHDSGLTHDLALSMVAVSMTCMPYPLQVESKVHSSPVQSSPANKDIHAWLSTLNVRDIKKNQEQTVAYVSMMETSNGAKKRKTQFQCTQHSIPVQASWRGVCQQFQG